MLARSIVVAVAGLSLAACATITRGTKDAWEVTSEPAGAKVVTSHGYSCEATPCAIKMPRKSQFTATLTKPGYKAATITVSNRVKGGGGAAMAGNLLAGGIIGAGVDASNGSMLDLVPNPAHVALQRELADR
jgi:hypothetical protein